MELDSSTYVLIALVALALSLFIGYHIIRAAVRSANSEVVHYLKILTKIKGSENSKGYNLAMKEVELAELERKKQLLSADDYKKKQAAILTQYQ
jgi:hypothetical protein